MAVAVIGPIVCIASPLEMVIPFFHNQVEVLKDNLAHFAGVVKDGRVFGF